MVVGEGHLCFPGQRSRRRAPCLWLSAVCFPHFSCHQPQQFESRPCSCHPLGILLCPSHFFSSAAVKLYQSLEGESVYRPPLPSALMKAWRKRQAAFWAPLNSCRSPPPRLHYKGNLKSFLNISFCKYPLEFTEKGLKGEHGLRPLLQLPRFTCSPSPHPGAPIHPFLAELARCLHPRYQCLHQLCP